MNRAVAKKLQHDKSFTIAEWIESTTVPITFLTSELLAARFLKLLGFNEITVTSTDDATFKDCVVNTWSSDLIGRNFFNKMNQYVGWNKLDYQLIISDCINSYYERRNNDDETNGLDVAVVSHTAIRGSNDWVDKQILTILSHIPKQSITEIRDTFNCFGDAITYEEVASIFYRDRLCQAVGRVIGNRGGKTTDLLIHKDILNVITNNEFPYTFNTNWEFTFEGFDFILNKIELAEQTRKEKSKLYKSSKIYNYNFLDELFTLEPDTTIPVDEVKQYLEQNNITGTSGKGVLPVSKVAEYFSAKITSKKLHGSYGKSTRCIVGVNFK